METETVAPIAAPVYPTLDDPSQFLSSNALPTDYAVLPRRKIRIKVRGIRSRERAEIEKRLEERKGTKKQTKEMNLALFREWLIIYGSIKENGDQLFGTEHLNALRNMPSEDIVAIADAIMKLSGMSEDDVEELVGNSESSPSIS